MSSLNGDVTVIRNGRSTSQVSIYNYPEHLNPFYDEDNHKRLRFWKIGRNGDNSGRRNSFSLGGLKDVWSFKSFRLKKKSSTLGINKTSESPPPLRREIVYDPLSRHTYNSAAVPNGNNNFLRSTPLRNSLQTVYHQQAPDESYKGFGLKRNDQYRSTIQTGGTSYSQQKKTSPASKRYIYGGSATPQPLRNSEFVRNEPLEIISRGSSQVSVYSTNPFETDDDENEVTVDMECQTSTIPKKLQRKKRRAPAPPVSTDKPSASAKTLDDDPSQKINLKCEQSDNSLTITELTAEIENFVNTSNADANKLHDLVEDKTVSKAGAELPGKMSNGIIAKEIQNVVKIGENEQCDKFENKRTNVHKEDTTYKSEEMGHIECIHVHLDTPKSPSESNEPSRVTSFKQISSSTPFTVDKNKKNLEIESHKTLNESENKRKKELPGSSKLTTKVEIKEEKIDADLSKLKSEHFVENVENDSKESSAITYLEKEEVLKSFKPPLAAKPNNIARAKTPVAEPRLSESPTDSNYDLLITEKKLETELCKENKFDQTPEEKLSIKMRNQLKIVEPEEHSSTLDNSKSSKNLVVHGATVDKNQIYPIDLMFRPKPASQLEWKKSTLATLETNVPPEKRKSVKDIIESINRSQKLLGASANKDQTSHNSLSLLNNEKQYTVVDETTLRALKPNTQAQSCEPNNDLDQNSRTLSEIQREIQRTFEDITCNDNSNKISYRTETITDDEHLNKKKNNDVFQKCKINKEVYNNRESSPTASNLDWNPVPKPKRAINTPSPELNGRFNDHK